MADGLRPPFAKTAALLEDAAECILAYRHVPVEHQRRLHSRTRRSGATEGPSAGRSSSGSFRTLRPSPARWGHLARVGLRMGRRRTSVFQPGVDAAASHGAVEHGSGDPRGDCIGSTELWDVASRFHHLTGHHLSPTPTEPLDLVRGLSRQGGTDAPRAVRGPEDEPSPVRRSELGRPANRPGLWWVRSADRRGSTVDRPVSRREARRKARRLRGCWRSRIDRAQRWATPTYMQLADNQPATRRRAERTLRLSRTERTGH